MHERYPVKFRLDSVGYTFLRGHRLALSLSPAYWPYIWPSRSDPGAEVSSVRISLPLVGASAKEQGEWLLKDPKLGPRMGK